MFEKNIKGRGAVFNPQNRFERLYIDNLNPPEWIDIIEEEIEAKIPTIYYWDESKSVIAKNNSYDLSFDYSFNPYRGCEHGCIYCYARPSHEFLGFSSGIDFETKIMVKGNAPKLLEEEFQKKSYKPDTIMFSGNTDCYQPVERKLKLTRGALEVCLNYRNPVSVITKNSLIQRDQDILKEMASLNLAAVTLSITSLDKDLIRKMEPRTSTPLKRFETIEVFAKNNIPIGVNVAPIIPGLNDEEIPAILEEAANRGAQHAGHVMLRLPYSVKDLFVDWLNREFPDRAKKVINRIREIRGGKLNSPEWGKRFSGEGELAKTIHNLFQVTCKKYHLNAKGVKLDTSNFRRIIKGQIELF